MRKTRKLGNSENILELGDMRYTERFDRSAKKIKSHKKIFPVTLPFQVFTFSHHS